MFLFRTLAALLACAAGAAAGSLTLEQRKLNTDSFEYAWSTIQKVMWEPMPAGLDWKAVHDELKPKVEAAKSMEEARAILRDMIARLEMTHFNIVSADVYEGLGGGKNHKADGGAAGFDIRLLEGEAVVASVEADSPADAAGVRPGWGILRAGGDDIAKLLRTLRGALRDSTFKELAMTRAVAARFDGGTGSRVPAAFQDGAGRRVKLEVQLKEPRGASSKIGFLPNQHVWYESKRIGNTGYIRFNMFLDPARLSVQFGTSVQSYMQSDGIVIDLRGNPGGIGGMSMGMAGWLVDRQGVRLGTMKTKEDELKFVIFPRPEVFSGPLAILVDGLTASTSEIFAGGLKDLGRARIFGTRTAGAALPSVFERLPNGDGFQYAIANYISAGGQPLEGVGVSPDEEVKLTRQALLAGRDPVVEAALAWIRTQGKGK